MQIIIIQNLTTDDQFSANISLSLTQFDKMYHFANCSETGFANWKIFVINILTAVEKHYFGKAKNKFIKWSSLAIRFKILSLRSLGFFMVFSQQSI
jgi:hypothetical protein